MKKISILLSAMCVFGCSENPSKKPVKGEASGLIERKSIFTNSLSCLGDMLYTYQQASSANRSVAPFLIAIPEVSDKSQIPSTQAEVPLNMTDMALGIAASIGEPVRVRHIPTPSEGETKDVYNKYNYYDGSVTLLYGSLTEFDKILEDKSTKDNISVSFLSDSSYGGRVGYSDNEQEIKSSMTMDFRVVTPSLQSITDKSTNQIFLTLTSSGVTYGLSAAGATLGTSNIHNKQDARHGAIRLLIEKGVIETIGKTLEVPYWRCLPYTESSSQSLGDKLENNNGSLRNSLKADSEFKVYKEITTTVGNKVLWDFSHLNEQDKEALNKPDEGVLHKISRKFSSTVGRDKKGNHKYILREYLYNGELLTFQSYNLVHHKAATKKGKAINEVVESNAEYAYVDKNGVSYQVLGNNIFKKVTCNVGGKNLNIIKSDDSAKKNKKEYCEIILGEKAENHETLVNVLLDYYEDKLGLTKSGVQELLIKNGFIKRGTDLYSLEMYKALYLNLPIEKNAKWKI